MDKPNILLIVLDSVRADRLSCYGYSRPTTPNIDRIAAEGTLFENCWSESSWTLPVAFSLLTGLVPREHLCDNYRELPRGLPTLAQTMQDAGYETLLCSANAFLGPFTGLDAGFEHVHLARAVRPPYKPFIKYFFIRMGWSDWGGEELTRALTELTAQAREPWFGVVWYNDCHHPYLGRGPFRHRFLSAPMSLRRRFELMTRMRNMQELAATLSERDRRDLSELYDGAIAYTDHMVGKLRTGLEANGRWEDTVVLIAADHGEMLGEHGLTSHGRPAGMYRPLLHVPLIIRAPGMVPAGHRSDALVQLTDVTETIARIAGSVDALPTTSSPRVDLREAVGGAGRSWAVSERAAWTERSLRRARRRNPSFDFAPYAGHMAAWVQDGWHLIAAETAPDELYNLADDPEERRNLIDDQPERARAMQEALRQWQQRVEPHPAAQDRVTPDDQRVHKHLEGLGYF